MFQKTILISLGVVTALSVSACGSDASGGDGGTGGVGGASGSPGTSGTPGAGGTVAGGGTGSGTGGAAAATCATVDFASYATGQPTMSFKTDIMPIFGFGCIQSGCHSKGEKKATLNLGVKCAYDATTKGCIFPATADPTMPSGAQPLDDQTVADVYASLMANSTTVQSPPTKRVVAGDPAHSFLLQKLSGKQNDPSYTCMSTDTSHAVDLTSKCGDSMPLGSVPLCEGSSRYKFDKIAAWVAQGAKNN